MSIFMQIQNLLAITEVETFIKLVLIVILSGIVGYERESWNKPAGFRTHVLVGISAVLVMICGQYLSEKSGADPTRIPAQLLSGIGFLGAGTILRDGFNVKGLTTAAGLLAITCIGLFVGAGYYLGAIIATAVVYVVLSYSHILSTKLEHSDILDLKVTASSPKEIVKEVNGILKNYNVEIIRLKVIEDEDVPDYVRIIMKYRESTDKNEILSKLIEIEKVKEVVEE
jgi:putative Mg2+ transporter-C (MgtC) family protein